MVETSKKGVLDSSSDFFVRSAPIGDVFSDTPVDRHGPVSLVAAVAVFCRHQGQWDNNRENLHLVKNHGALVQLKLIHSALYDWAL